MHVPPCLQVRIAISYAVYRTYYLSHTTKFPSHQTVYQSLQSFFHPPVLTNFPCVRNAHLQPKRKFSNTFLVHDHQNERKRIIQTQSITLIIQKKQLRKIQTLSSVFHFQYHLPMFFDENSAQARTPIALGQVEGTCSPHKMYHESCS